MAVNFSLPLPELCAQLNSIIESRSIAELESLFPMIVSNIFGLDNIKSWGLRLNSSGNFQSQVFFFLLPTGSLFTMCDKLCTNQCIRFNFPCNYLSESIQIKRNGSMDDTFYSSRLQFDEKNRTYSLSLNALEYYLFHFAYHLVNPRVIIPERDLPNITIYTELVIKYLQYFLPFTSSVTPQSETTCLSSPDEYSTFDLPGSKTYTKLGLQIFRKDVELSRNNVFSSSLIHSKPSSKTWYNEMVVRILMDFWLITENVNIQNQPFCGLFYSQSVSACNEYLKCIRALLKHLHYFAHNCLPEDNSPMSKFRRKVISQYRVKVYYFFRYSVKHYPLNGSFLYLAEAWLSYIQPWRYTFNANAYSIIDGEDTNVRIANVDEWLSFVAENLLTYTNIYYSFVSRFLFADLTEFKLAVILSRITKVFAQLFSNGFIDQIESCLSEDSSRINNWKFFIKHSMHSMENTSYTYVGFHAEQHFKLATRLIKRVDIAIKKLRPMIEQSTLPMNWKIVNWLADCNSNSRACKSCLNELTSCLQRLQFIHTVANLEELSKHLSEDEIDAGDSFDNSSPNSKYRTKNEEWLHQILSNPWAADHDEISPRSWEVSFLVYVLKDLSELISSRYSRQINELYDRQNISGKIARQIIEPPKTIQQYKKRCYPYGFTQRVSTTLPPRINLRKLASIYLLATLIISYFFLSCLGFSFIKIILIFLTFLMFYLVIMTYINPEPIIKLDDNSLND